MKEFLKTKGFKMTPQRELIFRSFFEMGEHVSVDELYDRVRREDNSVGYATVWRNLKLICRVGLAEEVNIGDGITRYDRVTKVPHGHLFCTECKSVIEFNVEQLVGVLAQKAGERGFTPDSFKIEVQGVCEGCRALKASGSNGHSEETGLP
ncbi:MAG: transcriptional repressor [Candidatus Zixiibacteriota bacterium]|nr:MAG: transcriptional repressor [candidate division Zixibacteria bacterium]